MAATHINRFTTNGFTPNINKDDPSQRHILYTKHQEQVALVNNIYDGVDETIQYLFQFPQENPDTFKTRQDRATLRNFVKRAVQAFTGMIFRKPMEIDNYGPRTTKLFDSIDTVQSIRDFTQDVSAALTKDSITYILADSPAAGSTVNNGRPYLMNVPRQSLINWRESEQGEFTMIVIEETVAEPYGMFGTIYRTQWRVYNEDANITIYRSNNGSTLPKDEGDATKTLQKLNSGGYYVHDSIDTQFTEIPIIKLEVDTTPILYDIAKLNIKHFNRMSHKDRYLTMAALPIPVIWGADIDDDNAVKSATPALVIGVDEAFTFSGSKEDSDFQWRELSGTSVDLLSDDLKSIVEDITTGILRAAETTTAAQKTATEVQLLQAEASNRVTTIANAVEVGMVKALELLSFINKETVPKTATFIINKDFNASLMGSDGARVIMESYLLGLVSIDTFLQTMSDMELIAIDSAKEELERIKADTFKPVPKGPDSNDEGGGSSPIKGADKRTLGALSNKGPTKTPNKKANEKSARDVKGKRT